MKSIIVKIILTRLYIPLAPLPHPYNVPHLFYSRRRGGSLPLGAGGRLASESRGLGDGGGTYLFQEQPSQLLATVVHTEAVSSINYPDKGVSFLKVVFPV